MGRENVVPLNPEKYFPSARLRGEGLISDVPIGCTPRTAYTLRRFEKENKLLSFLQWVAFVCSRGPNNIRF